MGTPEQKEPTEKHSLMTFVKENVGDTIAYVLLFAGIILAIFEPFFGGVLVGLILGIYFSEELFTRAEEFKELIAKEGIFRGFIVVAAVLALLILAFGLVLGTVIGAWVRPFLGNAINSPFDKPKT